MVPSYMKKWRDRWGRRLMSALLALTLSVGLLPGIALAEEAEEPFPAEIEQETTYYGSNLSLQELFGGLSYGEETIQTTDGQDVNTFVVTVDGSDDSLQVVTGVPNDEIPLKEGLTQTTSAQAAAAQMNGKNVLAAVNADFFNINDATMIQPAGVTIKDGELLTPYYEGDNVNRSYFFGVLQDGTAVIGDKETFLSVESDLQQAVGGGPWLVKEGEVQEVEDQRHPRTAVGIKEDGSILLVVADGRSSVSAGLTFVELARYMKDLGAVEALNLDGGGSSAAVVKNPDTYALEVKNVPSDGTERPVGNTLLVIDADSTSAGVDLEQDSDGYYLIEEAADFIQINKLANGSYRLNNDIVLDGESIPSVSVFSGEFDGADHTISGLSVDSGGSYALFTTLSATGSIHNLSLEDVDITASGSAAALVGSCAGKVEYVAVTGSIAGKQRVGGIVSYLDNGGQLLRSSAGVSITGTERMGGLVGECTDNSLIDSCYVNARVLGGNMAAGLVGRAVSDSTHDANIKNCIVTGSVQGAIEPGGIGGLLKIGVANCIVRDMSINATSTAGTSSGNVTGLLGAWINGSQPYTGNVIQSGSIIATAQCTAHRIGYQSNNKSYNYVNPAVTINGQPETGGTHDNNIGADATEEQLASRDFYAGLGFDFDTVFDWDDTAKTPVLVGVDQSVKAPSSGEDSELEQDSEGYYLIKTTADLSELNKAPLERYRLSGDLDFEGEKAVSITTFGGEFDGAGYTLSNLSAAPESGSYALFGTLLSGGSIHDLKLADVDIRASADYTAALVGSCAGTVEDVTVTGKIYGGGKTGAVAGSLSNGGVIRRCAVGAMVVGTGAQVGGVAGFNDGIIEACYANINVQGVNNVGGIAGYSDIDDATRAVRSCIAEGAVTSTGIEAGGIGGLLKMRTTNNLVRNMAVTATNATTAAGSGNVAGLLGGWMKYQPGATGNVILSGTVQTAGVGEGYRLCYNAGQGTLAENYVNPAVTVNGKTVAGGTASDGQGGDMTAEQMVSRDFYAGLGFDFDTVFDWDDAAKTPVLKQVDQTVTAPEAGPAPGDADVKNIALTVGTDETERRLSWYTDSTNAGEVQLAPASAMTGGEFPGQCESFASVGKPSSLAGYYSNQATLTGLDANTEYVYRVGNSDGWSDTYAFTTGSFDEGDVSFLFAGDPQIGSSGNVGSDVTGWTTSLNKAASWFDDVSFLLSAGDQVETYNNETQYAGFLQPEALRSMTLATNIGNHDSKGVNYQEHFDLPNEAVSQDDTAAGGDYWYSYNGVLFLSLNSNNVSTAQHKAFLNSAIQAYRDANGGADPLWKIVTFHHSVYSTASHTNDGDILQRRAELPLVFSELGIDAVLMGHDHVYTRSLMMQGTTPVTTGYTAAGGNAYASYEAAANSGEVFYLTANSASGSKFYAIKTNVDFPFLAAQNQESIPNLTKVDVTADAITFTTYRTGEDSEVTDVVDTFTLMRGGTPAEEPVDQLTTANAVWSYLDDNTDPGTQEDAKAWTKAGYDDSGWSSAKGSFGAKNGQIVEGAHSGLTANTLLRQYQNGTGEPNTPAFFFRAAFSLSDPEKVSALSGSLRYDDGVIVYINGVRVAGFNDEAITGNMSFNGGKSANDAALGTFAVSGDALDALNLKATGNVLAVELHNDSEDSSDVFLDFTELKASYPGKAEFSNIIMNVGADETERYVTWYSDSVNDDKLQLAFAAEPDTFYDYPATRAVSKYVAGCCYYHCKLTGIPSNMDFVYRVGNETDGWSDTYSFTSGTAGDKRFSFLLAGDPQIGSGGTPADTAGWITTMNKAEEWFPEAEFIISAGDQVDNKADESQFLGFTAPEQLKSLPMAVNVGNHDSGLDSYSEHYIVPNGDSGTVTLTGAYGGDYWYSYDGVLFLSINSNDTSTAKHTAFLKSAIAAYTAQYGEPAWKIVTFHHSVYSTASHESDRDIIQRRNELPVVFSELGIDAVLMGHDHVYTRTFLMSGTQPTTNTVTDSVTDPGYGQVLYLTANSASGSKFYAIHDKQFPYSAVTNQESVPNLTKVDVTEDSLTFTTYRTGEENTIDDVVDTFTIRRTQDKPENPITKETLISTADTTWKYLDDNTDPGTAEEPRAWTAADYADSVWKTGKGPFGAKDGEIKEGAHEGRLPATLLRQYQDGIGEPNTPAFFFRTTFDLADPGAVTSLEGQLYYDDAAVVYINGVKVAGYNDQNLAGNMSFSNAQTTSNADSGTFTVTGGMLRSLNLKESGNILAVELHNTDDHSSDIFIEFASLSAVVDSSKDTLPPVLTVPGEITLAKGEDFDSMEGVSASDLRDGDVTANIKVTGKVNTAKAGTYVLTYTVADSAGNVATVRRTVTVREIQTLITTAQTQWKYRDDNVDPAAGSSDRTSWTRPEYDDSDGTWKSAKGSFGAKNGQISDLGGGCVPATLLRQYQDGTSKPNTPAFFFRTTVTLSDAGKVEALKGTVCYDDGVILYVNGVRVAAFDDLACNEDGDSLGHGFDANLQYGGSNASDPKTASFSVAGDALKALNLKSGENTVAVELHNGRATSSDVYFDLLSLTAEMKISSSEGSDSGDSGNSGGSGSSGAPVQKERFTDVPAGYWAHDAIEFVAEEGLFQGTSASRFSPEASMTRAMVAAVLYRMAGEPESGTAGFPDVPADAWCADAIAWASEKGIVLGTDSGLFLPDNSVTRQELAAMLYRYAAAMGEDVSKTGALSVFTDSAAIPQWSSGALSWAVGSGILNGKSDGSLDPCGTATRAQVATMLQRFANFCK
ncbi:phosphodiester glycosidase family protein [Oscillibacter sp. MSJ-2]|uniref:Phosphodiester glycosidase family protein n=1 Tax=Dysosmobacter acutus TaxID=2841504 RepID=A0ABS6F8Q3_9FIRM|nr:phosphodiester glycosidase family protein [Dysosmobacter acutus]MBU5626655.1 phosphodiester glycosidase family protein [Dysosmobacter acutus]